MILYMENLATIRSQMIIGEGDDTLSSRSLSGSHTLIDNISGTGEIDGLFYLWICTK